MDFKAISKPKSPSTYSNDTDELVLQVWARAHASSSQDSHILTRFSPEKKKKILDFKAISKPKSPSTYSNDTDELVLQVWARAHASSSQDSHILTRFSPKKKKKILDFKAISKPKSPSTYSNDTDELVLQVWARAHASSSQDSHILTRFSPEKKKKILDFKAISKPKSPSTYSNDTDELVLQVWARAHASSSQDSHILTRFSPEKKKKISKPFQSQKALQPIAMIQTNWSYKFERAMRLLVRIPIF